MSLATKLAQIPNITTNYIPRATATGFVNGSITDDGTTVTTSVKLLSPIYYGGSLNSTRIYLDADLIQAYYASESSSRVAIGRDVFAAGRSGISLGALGAWAAIGANDNAAGNGAALSFSLNNGTSTGGFASNIYAIMNTNGFSYTTPSSTGGIINATTNASWTAGFMNHSNFLAPNMTGGALSVGFGKSGSTYNLGKIAFNYLGSGSSTNFIGLGFWDADNILNVLANGKVGIGTTSPAFKLSVANEMIVGAQGGTDYTYIRGGSGFGSMIRNYYAGGSVNNELSGNGNNLFSLVTGNVGIGIAVPTQKLDVYGNITINDQEFRWRSGTDGNHVTRFDSTTNGPFTFGYYGVALGYQAIRVIWTNTTNAYNYNNSTTWQQTSDIRIKQNIRPISEALNKICSLNPTHFEYKNKSGITRTGFIAQEFEQVFAGHVNEVIPTGDYAQYFAEGEMMKSIDADLIPYLVKAIQEQQSQIEELKSQLGGK